MTTFVPPPASWQGTLTLEQDLPTGPELWLRAPGQTFTLGQEMTIVLRQQEWTAIVQAVRVEGDGVAYRLLPVGTRESPALFALAPRDGILYSLRIQSVRVRREDRAV